MRGRREMCWRGSMKLSTWWEPAPRWSHTDNHSIRCQRGESQVERVSRWSHTLDAIRWLRALQHLTLHILSCYLLCDNLTNKTNKLLVNGSAVYTPTESPIKNHQKAISPKSNQIVAFLIHTVHTISWFLKELQLCIQARRRHLGTVPMMASAVIKLRLDWTWNSVSSCFSILYSEQEYQHIWRRLGNCAIFPWQALH